MHNLVFFRDSCILVGKYLCFMKTETVRFPMGRWIHYTVKIMNLWQVVYSAFEISKMSLIAGCEFHELACKTSSIVRLSLQNTKCQDKNHRVKMPKTKWKNRDKNIKNSTFQAKQWLHLIGYNFQGIIFSLNDCNSLFFFTVLSASSFHSLESLLHSAHKLSFWSSTPIMSFLSS